MIGIEPLETSTTHTSDADIAASHPRQLPLIVGVIIWPDDTEQDPTVIADHNPVTLARTMAVMIHEMIDDSPA